MRVRKSVSALAVALIAVVSALVALPSASAATTETQAANRIYSLINSHRADSGLAPLAWNPQISAVAQDWTAGSAVTAELAGAYTFDHNGRLPAGYPAGTQGWSENIVWNNNVDQAFSWWVGSPAHNANMLNPSFTDVGIGAVRLTAGPNSGSYLITADFGAYPAGSGGGLPIVSDAEKAEAERIAAEKAAAEKAAKAAADKAAADKAEADRVAKAAAEKAAADKAEADRVAKAAADKAAAEKAAADKAEADRVAKAAADKAAAEKAAADKAAAGKAAQNSEVDKAAAEKAAAEKAAAEKAAAERIAAEKATADKAERVAAEKAAADKAAAKAEADRVAAEQATAEKERQATSPVPATTPAAPSESPANNEPAAATQPEVEQSGKEPVVEAAPAADPMDPAVLSDSARGSFAAAAHGSLLTLKGLTPNASYRVVLHSTPVDLGLMTADSQGMIALEIPAELPAGNHRVALSSNGEFAGWQAFSVEAPVTVLGSAATAATADTQGQPHGTAAAAGAGAAEGQLAATGLNSWQLMTALLGALLVVAGTAAVVAVRRRTVQA
ncbi:CAP domain-containing protein [Arthrobacter zhangbolii]|uniref:CAP domain-containing protein n=1 Tax=Arthrobacter zhangbolii TaxID=2886936 RepID=A0A9X1M729_9MICC|nr:CAP domain-containing protein [Arthrobacter zhangbolii]MCC3272604.1 CAP domain-containing protein [Arthrobacter zhangbolii]UON91548.1 CAP domain-containing protein [Arthrobacter zhangbolii]